VYSKVYTIYIDMLCEKTRQSTHEFIYQLPRGCKNQVSYILAMVLAHFPCGICFLCMVFILYACIP